MRIGFHIDDETSDHEAVNGVFSLRHWFKGVYEQHSEIDFWMLSLSEIAMNFIEKRYGSYEGGFGLRYRTFQYVVNEETIELLLNKKQVVLPSKQFIRAFHDAVESLFEDLETLGIHYENNDSLPDVYRAYQYCSGYLFTNDL